MKHRVNHPAETKDTDRNAPDTSQKSRKRHGFLRFLGILALTLVVLGAIGRVLLPGLLRDYVNRTLDRSLIYAGKIGEIQIHLWRGAYSIQDIRLSKRVGNVPVPLFAARRVDFSIQWDALRERKVVGRVSMFEPQLNFVAGDNEDRTQTGAGGPWLQIIQDLFPFRINSATIHNGSVHFRSTQTKQPLDVYISQLEATIDNLGNIRSDIAPLIATVQANGMVMDQAPLELRMVLDPFAYRPTFHLGMRMLGLDVTKLNTLALAYGDFDFKGGWFDLVVEADAKAGQLNGYVKPLFRNLRVFSLSKDIKEDTVGQFFWQALLGLTTRVFRNQPRDQFGTLIPFSGDLSGQTSADILATVGNVLRNAFVRAYLPRLQSGQQDVGGLMFGAPDVSAPISPGEL